MSRKAVFVIVASLLATASLVACQMPPSGIIAIILGGLVTLGGGALLLSQGCSRRGPFGACLSMMPARRDAGVKADAAKPANRPDAAPKPAVRPCLSMPAPGPRPKPGAQAPSTEPSGDRAALLMRHAVALPDDVVRRLTRNADEEETP